MAITVRHRGNFKNTERLLKNASSMKSKYQKLLQRYGEEGVNVLKENTPVDTGKTAESWYYEVVIRNNSFSIVWSNSNVVNGTPIVLLIHYGHATKSGGYVQGVDFINPSLKPIFNKLSEDLWKEVTK